MIKNAFMRRQIRHYKERNKGGSSLLCINWLWKKKISFDKALILLLNSCLIRDRSIDMHIHSCLQSATTITIFSISWVVCRANSFISVSHTIDARPSITHYSYSACLTSTNMCLLCELFSFGYCQRMSDNFNAVILYLKHLV